VTLLGEAFKILQRYGEVIGVDWDKAPGPLDRLPNAGVLDLASSPILLAAQMVIKGMRATTGSGEPQDGAAFKKSAELYEDAGNVLIDAAVKNDRWNGTASDAYEAKNDSHRHLTLEVASAEKDMQGYLSALAEQVTGTRTDLEGAVKFLSDYDTATAWMNAVPGGAAVKAIGDTGVAATQVQLSQFSMSKLLAESLLNANRIRDKIGTYQDAAGQQMLDSDPEKPFPCGEPFGDERTNGQLPGRVDPNTNQAYVPPVPPPIEHPPATPYGTAAPR